jgi:hypothetical protein
MLAPGFCYQARKFSLNSQFPRSLNDEPEYHRFTVSENIKNPFWIRLKQLKLGMDSHPVNIYRAAIGIEARIGNMLIVGGHPKGT